MFARVKRRAERGSIARHDTRMGAVVCERDGTVAWARGKGTSAADGLLQLARKRWRKGSGAQTMAGERQLKGAAKAPEREAKLAKKRAGRVKKVTQLERLKGLVVVDKYKALKALDNEDLSDQLKYHKLVEKKSGFKTTGLSGAAMRLQLQSLIFEKFGAGANDLDDGNSGVDKDGAAATRKVRARKVAQSGCRAAAARARASARAGRTSSRSTAGSGIRRRSSRSSATSARWWLMASPRCRGAPT